MSGIIRNMNTQPVMIDPDLMDIVPGYLNNIRQYCTDMKDGLQHHEYEDIRRIGHGLKGTGSGYGFPEISRLGADIEDAARQQNELLISHLSETLLTYVNSVKIEAAT